MNLLTLPHFLAQVTTDYTVDRTNELSPEAAAGLGVAGVVFFIVYLALILLWIAGMWKTFQKAGQPGWAAIIPIYNFVVLWQITGKPGWVLALTLIPCTTIIGMIILNLAVAERFGKGAGFGLGLTFLPFIFYPMLGFGDARYLGPAPTTLSA